MAALPSPTQVAGNHSHIYEAYYNVVDPNGFGSVGGLEAARFLKRSGLSDVVLSRIWDLSDPGSRGSLDKAGMFVAMKLVALVQNGRDLSVNNISTDVPPPKLGDVPIPKTKATPLITSLPPTAVDWTIKPMEREKYHTLFDSLQPTNGIIPGNTVRSVLMESKLPLETLGKIWDLADQDKDGMLNRHEFVVAMHLVYKALEKYAIPNTLPSELLPPIKPQNDIIKHSKVVHELPQLVAQPPPPPVQPPNKPVQSVPPTVPWVVSADEKSKSDTLFLRSDIDKDGFVSGGEIKDVFLRSGVPQQVLAHIWALCDIKQTGKLNNEQFALAMWLVARCLKGLDPPATLTAEMVPPSFRTGKPVDGVVENNNTRYSNPELDMISKDIDELCRERLALETDIEQKEADIKIKVGEIKNLQSELDTLAATLKQLENQKGEAQKRLNDLKAQKSTLDLETQAVVDELDLVDSKVDKLRSQADEQAELVASQETELKSKKEQLESLRMEEQRLETAKNDSLKKLESLTSNLQDTQLNISQAKALTTQLEEQTRQINDALQAFDVAVESGDVSTVPDAALRISADFRNSEYAQFGVTNGNRDPFSARQNGDGFQEDPFHNDPFKSKDSPFGSKAFSKPNNGFDPFGNSFQQQQQQPDPFSNNFNTSDNPPEPEKDPFGCDPFAVLHAPTRESSAGPGRPVSPSPALPPKKQPPPRPAPPRPMAPPAMKKDSDPFGSGGGAGGFADFSNFEAKFNATHTVTTAATTINTGTRSSKGLDFSEDPFKNYRYEDPFNITFEEDDDDDVATKQQQKKSSSLDQLEKFDPFGLSTQKLVINNTSSSSSNSHNNSGRMSAPLGGVSSSKMPMSEDQQLAWAARESIKAEKERRRKQQEQEDAELQMALTLSKIELNKQR